MKFKKLYTDLTEHQKELVKPLLLIDDINFCINNNKERCIIDVIDKELQKCSFSLIFHKNDEKISFYVDNDISVFNYEDYTKDIDFRLWISENITFFLYSSTVIINFIDKEKIKKREVYISNYKGKINFDYPITTMNGFIWFWKKNRIKKIEKSYLKWLVNDELAPSQASIY